MTIENQKIHKMINMFCHLICVLYKQDIPKLTRYYAPELCYYHIGPTSTVDSAVDADGFCGAPLGGYYLIIIVIQQQY